jgi:putative ABC transport system substrate-binding protein
MASYIRRRKFLATLGGGAIAWPFAASAQQPTMPVIGFLNTASPSAYTARVRALHQGLSETGYAEDKASGCRDWRPIWWHNGSL